MKQPCGAKPAGSCSLSMPWIAANHKRDYAVSVSVADLQPEDWHIPVLDRLYQNADLSSQCIIE